MDELLNKLIEVDKSARERVAKAKKEKSLALEAVENKRQELKQKNAEKFRLEIEKENAKQAAFLEETSKQIDETCKQTISALKNMYEEKCGEWVDAIVGEVTK